MGKRTAQKDITIDTTSDSQVNSNFPNRWSPASLTFHNYFYLFLYLYTMRITTNNNAPHLKSPKNQSRRAALGRPAIKNTGGLELVCGRPNFNIQDSCRFKAFRPGEVRQIWYQNKATHLIYRLRPFMTVYNIPGVFAEHLNHMGVGRRLTIHLQHIAAAFTLLV